MQRTVRRTISQTITAVAPARRGLLQGSLAALLVDQGPVAALIVTYDGHVRYASPAAVRLLGLDARRLILAHSTDYLHLGPRIDEWLASSTKTPDITRVQRPDGSTRWVQIDFVSLPSTEDPEAVLAAHLTDRSASHELMRTTRAKAAGLDLVLAQTPVAVLVTDLSDAVVLSNPAAEVTFPALSDRRVGNHVRPIPPIDIVTGVETSVLEALRARALAGETIRDERVLAGRGPLWVSVAAVDVDIAGRVVWAFGSHPDQPDADARLRSSESRLRKILQHINDTVTVIDEEGNTAAPTGQFAVVPILGYSAEAWRNGLDIFDLLHPDDRASIGADLERLRSEPGTTLTREVRVRDAEGRYHHAEGWAVNLFEDPDVAGILLTTRNISARKRHEALLADHTSLLSLVAAGTAPGPIMNAVIDMVERQLPSTAAALLLSSPEPDRAASSVFVGDELPESLVAPLVAALCPDGPGASATDTLCGPGLADALAPHPELLDALGAAGRAALTVQRVVSGSERWGVLLVAHPTRSVRLDEHELAVLSMAADLVAIASERERSRLHLAYLALHDEVTGLANRHLLRDRLGQAINRARRRGRRMALMFLDIDHFKSVNDWLGHEAGDDLLRQFADRLHGAVRPEDTVARFGGDEFVVLIDHVLDEHDVGLIADRLQRSLDVPFDVSGHSLAVTASIGAAVADAGAVTPEVLLRRADAALYRAKDAGRNRLELFDEALESQLADRSRLEDDVRQAQELDQLTVRYRPQVDLASAAVTGVQVELRWEHPEREPVLAGELMDLGTRTGQMLALAQWVLERALGDLVDSDRRTGASDLDLHVDLAAPVLAHPEIVPLLLATLRRHGVEARRLVLQVPDAALAVAHAGTESNLASLRAAGLRVGLTGMGAGPSTGAGLGHIAVDQIEIHSCVTARLSTERRGQGTLAAALAGFAAGLGVEASADGVESTAMVELLVELGFRSGRGPLFGGPVDAAELDTVRLDGAPRPPR